MAIMRTAIKNTAGFVSGGFIASAFVLRMDDIMYSSLRRHVVVPVKKMYNGDKPVESREIMDLGSGATSFMSQLKPRATQRISAKNLLMDDGNYSTTQDHYFGYLTRRQGDLKTTNELGLLQK